MDARSSKKRKKIFLSLGLVIVLAIFYLRENEKTLRPEEFNKDLSNKSNTIQKANQKQSKLIQAKKVIVAAVEDKDFETLYQEDKKIIEKCTSALNEKIEKKEDFDNIKIKDYESTLRVMITECSFKIKSHRQKWNLLDQQNLSYEIASKNDLNRPVLVYLNIYREFFKNREQMLANLNNLISFISLNIYMTPPTQVADFYAWTGIIQEFLEKCGHSFVEGELLVQDIDRENPDLSEVKATADGQFEVNSLNEYLRREKEVVLNFQHRLQTLFSKYEQDLFNCGQ